MTSVSSGQPVRSKSRHKQPKEESKHEPTTGNESKQIKKAKYKAATEEALKRFNDLQMVEHKLASQTNEVMARVKNLFQPKREDMSDEEAFGTLAGDDLSGKNGLGNDKPRRAPSVSKRTLSTPATPIKPSTTRRTSQEIERPTKTSSSASGIDRQRTRTLDSSSVFSILKSHSRYASENAITMQTEKKSLKTARSEERIRSAVEKQKKVEKRKTIDASIKTIALEQLDKFASFQDFNSKRKSTIDNSSLSIDFDSDNDDSHQYGQTPSPLWPGVSKSKTMPITPPPSALTSKLPPPMPVRSSSYSSVGHVSLSKNIQVISPKEVDNLIENMNTTSSVSGKRRKSKVDNATSGSPNSSTSSTKTSSSRTTTPTSIASHRLSHPPPLKDAQPPPPVPTMPSMLPQPKLTRVNEEIPPVPAIPSLINSEKKVSISASSIKGSGDISPHGRKDNKSTDGHRPPSSSIRKKNRPRGTMSGQQQSDKIIRRQV